MGMARFFERILDIMDIYIYLGVSLVVGRNIESSQKYESSCFLRS